METNETNETQKPISATELTEEELKNAAGGINFHYAIATYECRNPNCQRITTKVLTLRTPLSTITCPDCHCTADLIKEVYL